MVKPSLALKSGETVYVTREASIQFVRRPILFRVIRVLDWITYDGWAWLEGYELDRAGDAVARRSIFVRPDGLRPVGEVPRPAHRRPTRRAQVRA